MSISKALQSLEGLATGDAFGAAHGEFTHEEMPIVLPPAMWHWTDDTHMAMSVAEILSEYGTIEQDALTAKFADDFSTHRFVDTPIRQLLFWRPSVLAQTGAKLL